MIFSLTSLTGLGKFPEHSLISWSHLTGTVTMTSHPPDGDSVATLQPQPDYNYTNLTSNIYINRYNSYINLTSTLQRHG